MSRLRDLFRVHLCVEACNGKRLITSRRRPWKRWTWDPSPLPGYDCYDPSVRPELGYGRYPNVVTAGI